MGSLPLLFGNIKSQTDKRDVEIKDYSMAMCLLAATC